MKIISHRGNINGPDLNRENKPWAIDECLFYGFDVEIDLWVDNNKLFLGHDKPEINISKYFLNSISEFAWIHAKNFQAINFLKIEKTFKLNWFWHETDKMTLTSKGIPWCYPHNYIDGGVTVCSTIQSIPTNIYGICTDFPVKIKELI